MELVIANVLLFLCVLGFSWFCLILNKNINSDATAKLISFAAIWFGVFAMLYLLSIIGSSIRKEF